MDIPALLAPITPDAPCGDDLSFSPEFDAIQELRREDDPTLAQGEWVKDLKVADWAGAVQACSQLLSTRTKDLRVVGWLADASGRVSGFAGLANSLDLCNELVARYWVDLYPRIDDGDTDQRVSTLSWLLGRVEALARIAPLARQGGKLCCLRDLETARARQRALARGVIDAAQATADGTPPLEALQRLVVQAGRESFDATLAHARRAQAALARLQEVVDGHLGADGPAFTEARKTLELAVDTAERLGRDAGFLAASASTAAPAQDNEASHEANALPAPGGSALAGPPRSRAQALQQLREVAEFFRRTEPHSPVAYLADKAAKWGDMPLHAWLRSVVKDGGSLAHLEELLGVDPLPPSDAG